MVDSVSGSQNQQHITGPKGGEAREISEKVALGFDPSNSTSQTAGTRPEVLEAAKHLKPTIAPSDPTAEPPTVEQLQTSKTQAFAAGTRAHIALGVSSLQANHPDAITPERLDRLENIQNKLSSLEDISPEGKKGISLGAEIFASRAGKAEISPDQLDFILTQIETQLGDATAKYSETKLQMAAQDKIQQSESNIKEIRKNIEEIQEQKQEAAGLLALKIIISIFIPVIGAYEAAHGLSRGVSGRDNGLSMFSSPAAQAQAASNIKSVGTKDFWENLGQRLGEKFGILEPQRAEDNRKTNESGELDFTTEGPALAESGLSQAEFMKLLQQAQVREESKEKLAEAIAALQSGNPKEAAEILKNNSDSITLVDDSGQDLIPLIFDQFGAEPTDEQIEQAFTEFTEDLINVADGTQQSLDDSETVSSTISQKTGA